MQKDKLTRELSQAEIDAIIAQAMEALRDVQWENIEWHAGNDGVGSGFDYDVLDGLSLWSVEQR